MNRLIANHAATVRAVGDVLAAAAAMEMPVGSLFVDLPVESLEIPMKVTAMPWHRVTATDAGRLFTQLGTPVPELSAPYGSPEHRMVALEGLVPALGGVLKIVLDADA